MATDRARVLAELDLPLTPEAGPLEALWIAVAVEDALGVTIPDDAITVRQLGDHASLVALLDSLAGTV